MIDEFGLTGALVLVMVRIASGKKLFFIYNNFVWEIADGDN